MPLLLDNNPNPKAVMLGSQHLRKIMLGEEIVWQKIRQKLGMEIISLESLEHQNVLLRAANRNGNLYYPMVFPHRLPTERTALLDKLTFFAPDAWLAGLGLESIDAMLIADVQNGKDLRYPMAFPNELPSEKSEFLDKLTFFAPDAWLTGLGLESIDAMLVADVRNSKDLYYPMVFPDTPPSDRSEFLGKLTFIGIPYEDFVKDFSINVFDPAKDFIKDFNINTYDPRKDFFKDQRYVLQCYEWGEEIDVWGNGPGTWGNPICRYVQVEN